MVRSAAALAENPFFPLLIACRLYDHHIYGSLIRKDNVTVTAQIINYCGPLDAFSGNCRVTVMAQVTACIPVIKQVRARDVDIAREFRTGVWVPWVLQVFQG
jgi:hypothetical protein